jgi:hypothetical protein
MINVYFHIDELNRDSIVANEILRILKNRRWNVTLGNRQLSKLLKKYEAAFDVIILPKPHFISAIFGEKDIVNLGSKFIMLYTESIGIIANDKNKKLLLKAVLDSEFMSGETKYVDKVSAFCFWGPRVRNIVAENYPSLAKKSYVIGHPRHHNANYLKKLNFSSNNNIGIITRFQTLNDYLNRHPMEIISNKSFLGDLFEYNNLKTGDKLKFERRGSDIPGDILTEAIDFQNLIEITRRLLTEKYKITWKVHPRENPVTYKKILKHELLDAKIVEQKIPFTNWAADQKYLVGSPSTSFYDSYLMRILPISIAKIDTRRTFFIKPLYEENNDLMKNVFEPRSINELIEFIKYTSENKYFEQINDHNVLKVLHQEVNFPDYDKSIKKLVEIIEQMEIEKNKRVTKKIKLIIFKTKSYMYSELFNMAYFILNKFNLGYETNSSNFFLNIKNRRFIKSINN